MTRLPTDERDGALSNELRQRFEAVAERLAELDALPPTHRPMVEYWALTSVYAQLGTYTLRVYYGKE